MKHLYFLVCMIVCLVFASVFSVNADDGPYRVGINDVITINVAGYKEYSTTATVLLDGTISYPYLGSIYVNGKTLSEIKDELTKRLSEGYIQSPVVTVSLQSSASKRIYLYGEQSGFLPFEKDLTVGKALILKGIDKEVFDLKIRRKKGSGYDDINADIKGIIDGVKKDIPLKPDDILIVKSKDFFFIQGEVEKPGKYILKENITVLQAITEAGGIKEGGLYGEVKVRRQREKSAGYDDIKVDIKEIRNGLKEDLLLKRDDILIISPNNKFIIYGEVLNPGEYVLEDYMTVRKAIAKAGGIKEEGLYGNIKIRRSREGSSGYKDIEIDRRIVKGLIKDDVLLEPDDILIIEKNNKFIIQGEVLIKPGEYVLEDNMTVGKAIAAAGGIKEEGLYGKVKIRRMREDNSGYDDIEMNVKDIIDGKAGSTPLLPDDIVIVEGNKTFMIYGEVNRIGEYPVSDNITVFKAITLAGGFTKWGSPRRIKILRPKDNSSEFEIIKVNVKKVIDGDATADVIIKPGDIVIVSSSPL